MAGTDAKDLQGQRRAISPGVDQSTGGRLRGLSGTLEGCACCRSCGCIFLSQPVFLVGKTTIQRRLFAMEQRILIVAAKRTPFGRFRGSLSRETPVSLAVSAGRAVLAEVGARRIEQCVLGNVLSAGYGMNIARQVALQCGLPENSTAMTVNMMCGSGLQSIQLAVQSIRSGQASAVLAGGVESMSRSALLVARPGKGQQPDFSDCRDSMVTDGLTDCGIGLHMGQTAELLAAECRISRESQDLWALRSQRLAGQASAAGIFQAELTEACGLSSDEHPRPHLTLGDLTGLAPVFESTGTVTAGNSSGLNDGAAMLLLASEEAVRRNDWPVLCEWVDGVSVGCNPRQMGLGPVYATEQLLQRTGTSLDDVDQLEINEAFAAQTLACVQRLGLRWTAEAEAEPAESGFVGTASGQRLRLNPYGGAIAIGHPLAASGARLMVHLAHQIHAGNSRRAVAALCVGGGMGIAGMLLEFSGRDPWVV